MLIFYFSGTGNTKNILDKIVDSLNNHSIEAKISTISSKTRLENKENIQSEPVCLLFPINAHAISPFIWKFIKDLPEGHGREILVFYTYNSSAAVGEPIKKVLKDKGYNLKVLRGIQMPNHLIVDVAEFRNNQKRFDMGMQIATKTIASYLHGDTIIDYKTDGSRLLSFFNRHTSII